MCWYKYRVGFIDSSEISDSYDDVCLKVGVTSDSTVSGIRPIAITRLVLTFHVLYSS